MVRKVLVHDQEFIARIRKIFDLNLYEAKVWVSLLSKGVATAGELSEIAQIPRSRAYDILESLERKGFVVMKLGKPVQYIAIPPEEVLERFKVRIKEEAKEKINTVEKLRNSDLLSKLRNLYKESLKYQKFDEIAGAVRGRVNVLTSLESVIKEAKSSVEIMLNNDPKEVSNFASLLKKVKGKGVKVKVIVPEAKEIDVKELKEVADVKLVSRVPTGRFVIVDGKKVFMLMNEGGIESGVWIQSEELGKPLSVMFRSLWNK